MLISTIQNISVRHSNVFMVFSHLDSHCFSVQMEPSSSPIKIKSWTILHQPMMMQFNAFCKFQSIMNLMHHPILAKFKRLLVSYQIARWPGLMLYWLKYTNMADLYCTRSWSTSSSPYGSKILYHKTSRMHLSFISTREKRNCQQCDNHHSLSLLSITGKVLARVLLNHLTMYLAKGSSSGKSMWLPCGARYCGHDFSQLDSCKRSAKSKDVTCTQPL